MLRMPTLIRQWKTVIKQTIQLPPEPRHYVANLLCRLASITGQSGRNKRNVEQAATPQRPDNVYLPCTKRNKDFDSHEHWMLTHILHPHASACLLPVPTPCHEQKEMQVETVSLPTNITSIEYIDIT